jgi:hypothetical protein
MYAMKSVNKKENGAVIGKVVLKLYQKFAALT